MYAPLRSPQRTYALLVPLHLSLAAVFAFVLPFICWGALATPGHPHGLPHFVFFAPQTMRSAQIPVHEGAHDAHQAPKTETSDGAQDDLAAQSVTPVLGVALLAPLFLLLAALLFPELTHISRQKGERTYCSLISRPTPPPPRQLATPPL